MKIVDLMPASSSCCLSITDLDLLFFIIISYLRLYVDLLTYQFDVIFLLDLDYFLYIVFWT